MFELIVAEAHRCAGQLSSDFSAVLDGDRIRARRRLFMTATPRFFTGRVIKVAGDRCVISFHSRVARAQEYTTEMPAVIDWTPARQRLTGGLWSRYASGAMSAGERHVSAYRNLLADCASSGTPRA